MRILLPALVVVATASFASCGDDDSSATDDASSATPSGQPQTPDAAVAAFDQYIQAVAVGDAAACDLETADYSSRANAQFDEATKETTTDCPTRIGEIEALAKQFGLDLTGGEYAPRDGVTSGEVTVDVDWPGDTSSVYVMQYDDGAWLVADDDTLNADLLD